MLSWEFARTMTTARQGEGPMDIGARLRTSREAQGLSLLRLAEKTRVQPRILAAIELNDLSSIPPKPFGRGFVRTYAHEVGLDPDRTVHDYFGQFATDRAVAPPATSSVRLPALNERAGWVVPAAVMVVLAVGTIFFLASTWNRAGEASGPSAVGTSGATATRPASSGVGTARAAGTVGATTAQTTEGLLVVIRADRLAWLTASADGKRVIYQLMPAGSERTVRAVREISLRAGDAGALRLIVNGREAGTFGSAGEVRNARITPSTVANFLAR
jgi:cytoskeleton protein RodZ